MYLSVSLVKYNILCTWVCQYYWTTMYSVLECVNSEVWHILYLSVSIVKYDVLCTWVCQYYWSTVYSVLEYVNTEVWHILYLSVSTLNYDVLCTWVCQYWITTYSVLECVNIEIWCKSVVGGLLLKMVHQRQHVEREHSAVRNTLIGHSTQHTHTAIYSIILQYVFFQSMI